MSVPDNVSRRRAALLLHSLNAKTREQVIARLSSAETALIAPLLQELRTLGVSPELGAQLSGEEASSAMRTARQAVDAMDAEIVARCLERCSASTAAHLITAASWRWQERILDCMSAPRRIAVHSCLRGRLAPLAPAVVEALCARIVAEARRLPASDLSADPWMRWIETLRCRAQRVLAWMR